MRTMTRSLLTGLAAAMAAAGPAQGQDCSPTDLATAEQSYSTAYQLVTANQWAEAVPSLEMASTACPTHWNSVELLAQAYARTKEFEKAANTYKLLVDGKFEGLLAAADQNVLFPYGDCLLRAGKYPESQEVLEAVVSADPMNYKAHELLAYRFERSRMHEEAVRHLLVMEQQQADDAARQQIAQRIAKAYDELGDKASASEWYGKTKRASSGLFNIGVDHMKSQDWAQAIDSFTKYLESKPDNVAALKNRGQCFNKIGKKAEARSDFERVLALDASRHDVASTLGFLYLDAEMYGKAATIANAALSSWPKDDAKLGSMYYLMGKVLEKRDEKYEEAIEFFQQATSDSYWGGPAKEEITRQRQLIEIRDMKARSGGR